jgi:hypothetical protein
MSTRRRLFPYVATFLALLVVAVIFVLRPTPFIGVTGSELASSLNGQLATATVAGCDETGEDAWRCSATAGGSGAGDRDYEVTINGFGCWTATPAAGAPRVGTPATLTGCVTFLDH